MVHHRRKGKRRLNDGMSPEFEQVMIFFLWGFATGFFRRYGSS
jgi:hypothetical protein